MEGIDKLGDALKMLLADLSRVEEPWLIGGSCGLLMQGVSLAQAPRDLDMYADRAGAAAIHSALLAYSVDEQQEDRSSMYCSVLSHYRLSGITLELVGDFEVTAHDSVYRVETDYLYKELAASYPLADSAGKPLKLMPLEHELIFNLLRDRPDRYEAIARVMAGRYGGWTKALDQLVARNRLSDALVSRLQRLLQG
ncbi:hypothetical protein N0M98_20255 [Paenibacillus doosanensis]|uniref:hypothetical protein n=1 Tax=Paenibacillus doosanensis TaxID=1229154 RepID=UPI0021802AEE|nr:hypothetical protein [Paenibacillus doosanensis]MCS7462458.1 hypothetical protein [Paenibacillus doosanensis]